MNFKTKTEKYWFIAFLILVTVGFFTILKLSTDAGMSGDEETHYLHSENVYKYYASGGKDSTAAVVTDSYNLPLYGQSVDNLAYLLIKVFDIDNFMTARHLINAICGWLAMLFIGLLAYRLAGWRAAVISFVLVFLSPRFLGHSFNNLKDLPFATASIMGIYFLTRFLKEFPKVSYKTAIFLALTITFAISVRVAGLILICYFGLFCFILYIQRNYKSLFSKESKKEFLKMVGWGLGISVVGYILAVLTWPYAIKSPIDHVIGSLGDMSKFAIAIRQLFEGELQWSDKLPFYYTPKFILMTIPIAVILGLILFFTFSWKDKKNRFWYFVVFFTFFFPIFWIVYSNANVYGGWRHAIFSYPPMVVAAGLGFNLLIQYFENKKEKGVDQPKGKKWKMAQYITTILPFVLLISPLAHTIKNHPYEYVYFNEFVGGAKGAYGNYEGDYYYHSTREACEWVINNAKQNPNSKEKIKVVSWHFASLNYYFRNDTTHFQTGFVRWYEKGNVDWDYAIFTVTGMAPEQLKNSAIFPPSNTVYTIKVDGTPIAFVLKRMDKSDFIGYTLKEEKKYDSAVVYLKKAIQLDPTNEAAHVNLIESYFNLGKLDSAKIFIDKLLVMVPKYETANYFLANYYMAQKDYDKALKICKKLIKDNLKFKAGYLLGFQAYAQKGDLRGAEKMMISMMKAEQMDNQGLQNLLNLYKAQGMDDRAAYKKIYKLLVQTFEELGKEKEAEEYREVYNQL